MTEGIKPGKQEVCKQRPDRDLNRRKESDGRKGLLTLKSVEMEKLESWPKSQTLILDYTNAECANAQNQDPDCDDDRAEEQSPFSDSAHMGSPSNGLRVSGERRAEGDERVRCTRVLGDPCIQGSKRAPSLPRTSSLASAGSRPASSAFRARQSRLFT